MAELQAKQTPGPRSQAQAQYRRGRLARAKEIIRTLADAGMLEKRGPGFIIKGDWKDAQ